MFFVAIIENILLQFNYLLFFLLQGNSVIWLVLLISSNSFVFGVEYPAGVDPNSCPNYPFCSNNGAVYAEKASLPSQAYQPQSYQAPQYNAPLFKPQSYQPQSYQPQQYQSQYQSDHYQPQYQRVQYQPQQYQAKSFFPQSQQYVAPNQYNFVQERSYNPAQNGQYSTDIQKALDRGEYIGDGDYHGEGLAEALAPGYEGKKIFL